MSSKILVVDDEQTLRSALFRIFSRRNYQVITTANLNEAEKVITSNSDLELAIVDVKLPDGDGIDLITTLKQKYNDIPVYRSHRLCKYRSCGRGNQERGFSFYD